MNESYLILFFLFFFLLLTIYIDGRIVSSRGGSRGGACRRRCRLSDRLLRSLRVLLIALPLMLGAKDVALPRLNLLSFYLWLSGAVLAALAIGVWHFWHVIFHPDEYPMNTAWITVTIATKITTCVSVPVKKVVMVPSSATVPNIGAMAPAKK